MISRLHKRCGSIINTKLLNNNKNFVVRNVIYIIVVILMYTF